MVEIFRLFSVVSIGICVLQIIMMLVHYRMRLMPLRKELGESVVAPPVRWTFAYHVATAVLFCLIAVGLIQNAYAHRPPNVFTYTAPFVLIAFNVILQNFVKYYSRTLNAAHRQTEGHP